MSGCYDLGLVCQPMLLHSSHLCRVACVRILFACRNAAATLLESLGLGNLTSGAWKVHLGHFKIFFSDYFHAQAWRSVGACCACHTFSGPCSEEGLAGRPLRKTGWLSHHHWMRNLIPNCRQERRGIGREPLGFLFQVKPGKTGLYQRRWIFDRQNLPSPHDNPFAGMVFDPANRVEWGDPVPQHVWELRAWKQFDLCVNQRDHAKGWGRGAALLRLGWTGPGGDPWPG
eukprot:575249-Amphidinium_carterae.3